MKSTNELHRFVLLENGDIQRAFYDADEVDTQVHIRHFDYNDKGDLCLCYDKFDGSCFHYCIMEVVDTADTEEELERRKKEL